MDGSSTSVFAPSGAVMRSISAAIAGPKTASMISRPVSFVPSMGSRGFLFCGV